MSQKTNETSNNSIYQQQIEAREARETEQLIRNKIQECAATVFKSYLPSISTAYSIKPLGQEIKPEETVAYFDVTRLVIEDKERMSEKLKNVYHLLACSNNSIALIIRRKHNGCQIGLAVGKQQDSEAAAKLAESVQDAIIGNFPGTTCGTVQAYSDTEDCVFQALNNGSFSENDKTNFNSVAIATNIASEFTENSLDQGIEKIIDGIVPDENKEYTIVILGESLTNEELEKKKEALYSIYTGLSPFAKRTENWGLTNSQNWGKSWNAGFAFIATAGGSGNSSEGFSKTSGASVEIKQYGVQHTLEIIEKQMERLEKCEALGIWNVAAYVFSSDCQLASEVAHMYMSLTQGNESFYEKPAINIWNSQKNEDIRNEVAALAEYIRRLMHPSFIKKADIEEKRSEFWNNEVTATSLVSGAELALAMNLPKQSVPGFSLIECAAFGREISSYDKDYSGEVILGQIHHMHHDEETSVGLDKDSFCSHVFITGSTGAGKSNTVYALLDSLDTTYMVIEPAKGEYKYRFAKEARVFGSNPNLNEILRINPFSFNKSIHVYEHIDRLLDVFNVCWPMYAAMPAVLKDAIISAYEKCGWDLTISENKKGDVFPTFSDVCDEIDVIINNSDYSDENKGNYRGSLKTRLRSLTNGINQLMFCNGDLTDADLFENNVIIDLSRMGSAENKSLVMGLLVIRLQEYRMSQHIMNSPLRHITVLEEAHHLLKRAPESISAEGASVSGKAVEMIANAIAEMRTYGEGFIIVDQAPSLLDMSVIRNTNTKIIHRLPDQDDRELVGRAANLNDDQIRELARLQRGVAAVYQNEWIEPILCKVQKSDPLSEVSNNYDATIQDPMENMEIQRYVNSCVYDPEYIARESDYNFLDCIEKINCQGSVKALLIDFYNTPLKQAQKIWQKLAFKYFNISKCLENLGNSASQEEWQTRLKEQLSHFEFLEKDIVEDANRFYRFAQLMTLESMIWLANSTIDQPEKSLQLKSYLYEFRDSFLGR